MKGYNIIKVIVHIHTCTRVSEKVVSEKAGRQDIHKVQSYTGSRVLG